MIVCVCEGVSYRKIENAAKEGAKNVKQVSKACGAGLGCGACHKQIWAIIKLQKAVASKKTCVIPDQVLGDAKSS